MANLEDNIRDLISRGELSHLSLTPSHNGKKWRGSFTMTSKFGVSLAEDADPIKALSLAMTTAKMKPRPATRREAAAAEARSTGSIPQATVDAQPAAEDVEDLM